MKSRFISFFLLANLIMGGGCCHLSNRVSQQNTGERGSWLRTELYFGLRMPGGTVSEEDWNRFVEKEITPRFPGLTVINAYGQWRGASGNTESEPSRLVIIFHTDDSLSNSRLEEIRSRYCAEFRQESVLRADEPAVVSFTNGGH